MFALKSAQRLSRAVRIEWVDGLRADFTYVWLRDNSQRRPSLVHLELNTQPEVRNRKPSPNVIFKENPFRLSMQLIITSTSSGLPSLLPTIAPSSFVSIRKSRIARIENALLLRKYLNFSTVQVKLASLGASNSLENPKEAERYS